MLQDQLLQAAIVMLDLDGAVALVECHDLEGGFVAAEPVADDRFDAGSCCHGCYPACEGGTNFIVRPDWRAGKNCIWRRAS